MRTRGKLLGAFLGALSLAAALTVAPSPALAAEGQIKVSVPTTVPCVVKHDGTVIAPSSWKMKNVGSEEVSLGKVSVNPSDKAISLSASSSVGDGAKSSEWFSYENGTFSQAKTGEALAPGASVSVKWSVGRLDAAANASTLKAAANGTYALARVDFTFGQKQAFAVRFSDGTAGLYKRFEVPSVGDIFDDRTVTRVVTDIENKNRQRIFYRDSGLTSVTAVDEGIRPKTLYEWFRDCTSLKEANLKKLDTSKSADMNGTFQGCSSLTSVDVSKWDTSNFVTTFYMFSGCGKLTTLDVSNWKTSNVTDMCKMFYDCSALAELDVSGWKTSNVTDMRSMFDGCKELTTLDVSKPNWNVSSVADMSSMFYRCGKLTTLDVSGWDTSSVTNLKGILHSCPLHSLTIGPQWTKSLELTGLPGTLYRGDGTACAIENAPVGVTATYYTELKYVPKAKAEHVPQGDPADKGAATAAPTSPES